jgi:hypothetical protein
MALGWFVCPYSRRNPGEVPAKRYCSVDDFTALVRADGGDWDETEILGDVALVKVRASQATLDLISNAPGVFTIPQKWINMQDDLSSMTAGERNQISNAVLSLGYSQAELDLAMGSSLAQWQTHVLEDLLVMASARRLKPRYDQPSDSVVCDGPVQPVKDVHLVANKVT